MLYKTHLAFGGFAALISIPLIQPSNPILFLLVVLGASLLPDVDHPNSKLGRYVKPIGILFEHRGFFHSIFPILFMSLLLIFYGKNFFILPFSIGYTSHLIGDLITKQGIMPMHPISRKRISGIMATGGIMETILFISFILVDFILLFRL